MTAVRNVVSTVSRISTGYLKISVMVLEVCIPRRIYLSVAFVRSDVFIVSRVLCSELHEEV
jgi:hypothetical protein